MHPPRVWSQKDSTGEAEQSYQQEAKETDIIQKVKHLNSDGQTNGIL